MEYGYLYVTPNGNQKGILNKVMRDIITFECVTDFTILVSIKDFSKADEDKLVEITKNQEFYNKFKKKFNLNCVGIFFIKGTNAISKLKEIADKYNENSKSQDKSIRYLDNVYVSNSSKEAIEDVCEYTNCEDFSILESVFDNIEFENKNKQIYSFNFKALSEAKNKKLI